MDFSQFIDPVVAFVKAHKEWAVPIVFLLAFGESLAFFSLLLPATVILVAISGFMGAAGINFWPVWIAGGIGGALGYAISYWVGYYFKDHVHQVWPFSKNPEMLPRGEAFFHKYGALGVFLGHFFGPVRAVIPVVAGMFAMPQLQFQLANVTSAFLWAGGVMAPGALGIDWLKGYF